MKEGWFLCSELLSHVFMFHFSYLISTQNILLLIHIINHEIIVVGYFSVSNVNSLPVCFVLFLDCLYML